jgi:hypothetical protein
MAVAFDAVGPSSAGGGTTAGASATSASWSHTATGTNRYVLAMVSFADTSGSTPDPTVSATYGGTAMSNVGSVSVETGTVGSILVFFGLVNPATGAQTIALTSSKADFIVGGSVSFTGVDQTSPVGTPVSANPTAVGTSLTASITGASTSQIAWFFANGTSMTGGTVASTASWTNRFIRNNTTAAASANVAGFTGAATGSAQTVGYTATASSDHNTLLAIEVRQAGAATAPLRSLTRRYVPIIRSANF